MKQRLIKSLMLIAVLLTSSTVWAYSFESDGIYYDIISSTKKTVRVTYKDTDYNSYAGDMVIPETVTKGDVTYSVTSIRESAFQNCSGLISVTIPNSVTTIGNGAFSGCSSLTSVTIPNSVTSIGKSAFSSCSSLTSVIIPNSVTKIGIYAFSSCSSLTSVTIPNSVTNIGYRVFTDCSSLTSVIIPNSVTSIGEWAFHNCTGLTSVTIPNSVTSIGSGAFSGCENLASIIVEQGNTRYDSRDNCNAVIETTTNKLIQGCNSTVIPNSVTSIGNGAFSRFSSLTSVTIPNSVTSIGDGAFSGCENLTYIELPSTITNIGENAFYLYSNITRTIKCKAKTPPTLGGSQVFRYNYLTLEVPFESILAYQTVEGWTKNSYGSITYKGKEVDGIYYLPIAATEVAVISTNKSPEGYTPNISEYTGNIVIPSYISVNEKKYTVISIDDYAFYGCTGLTSVTIPECVTTIGENAFYGCTGLTSVTIPECVTTIGENAFFDCTKLESIELPSIITNIGKNAFYISSKYIARTIKCKATTPPTLGNNAFYRNYLTLEVPFESVLAYQAVEGWTKNSYGSITYKGKEVDGIYYLPTSETEVAVVANPSKYTGKVVIPAEITVGEKTFKVTSIGNEAFSGCSGLTYIELPSTITNIGSEAFYHNYSSTNNYNNITRTIKCNAKTPPTLGNDVFYHNSITLEVPFESVLAYQAVESWNKYSWGSITYKPKEVDDIYYMPTATTEVKVTYKDKNYNSYSDNVVIPDTIMVDSIKYNVTSIGDYAFYNCNKLNGKLSIPSSVKSIGTNAFYGTKYSICDIEAATPPTITSSSLSYNTSLVLVPTGTDNSYKAADIWKDYTIIAEGACDIEVTNETGGELARSILTQTRKNLQNITGLKVHGKLNSIDLELINTNMSSLLHLDITDTDVTEIPTKAFMNIVTLMSVKLPNGLQTIGDYAFSGCKVLSGELELPEKLIKIGNYTFQNCSNLSDTLKIPANVTNIGSSTFSRCINIKNIDMTEATKLYELGANAFEGCKSIETVLFPETLETIGNKTFYNCTKLNNVELPAALKTINSSAFYGCTGMTSIDFSACTSLTTIYGSAFYGCTSLSMLDLSSCESLITINKSAFSGCSSLGTINFPTSLVSIGSNAFANCTNLLQLSVPCTVPPVIENHAEPFAGVDNIACILSIPSDNFFDYYSANYWGGFVDVESKGEIQNEVNNPTDEDTGEGDETEGGNKKHGNGCHIGYKKHENGGGEPRLMALKGGAATLAEAVNTSSAYDLGLTGDGQSLFAGFGESVTYYFTPEEGKEIESIYFNDEDVTSQLVDNTLTVTVTSDMTMTKLIVNLKNASSKLAGDVNGDGEVNVSDVVKLYSYILGNTTGVSESVADLNGDGEVNVSDIVKLYSIILSSN